MTDSIGPATPSERTTPWRAIAAVGGAIVVGVVVIAALALRDNDAGTASPGSASPVVSASPVPSPTETDPSSTPAAGSSSPGPETPAAIPENWTAAATFSEAGKRYVLGDLANWSDGLVAVGTYYEEEFGNVFGPPPTRAGRVWRSTDGINWTDATPVDTFADVELAHLFAAEDGALIAIGHTYPELDPVSAAWETRDGETWTPIDLAGLADGTFVLQVASGARGHVASTFVGAEPHPLYSADGRSWEPAIEDGVGISTVAAGDEGFVAHTFDPVTTTEGIVASADGRDWFDATEPDDGSFLAAPRGADWLATTSTFDGASVEVETWGSANGLDWSPLGVMPLRSVDVGNAICLESPGALHGLSTMTVTGTLLSGPCSEGAVVAAGGSYASLDGAEWTRLPFGDRAYAAGAAMVGDRVVVATDARTNQAPVVGVIFWITEAP